MKRLSVHWSVTLVLPALHLAYCFAIHFLDLNSGWGNLLALDFPASVVAMIVLARLGEGSALFQPIIWFGLFGTAWWFFLSNVAIYLLRKLRFVAQPEQPTGSSMDESRPANS